MEVVKRFILKKKFTLKTVFWKFCSKTCQLYHVNPMCQLINFIGSAIPDLNCQTRVYCYKYEFTVVWIKRDFYGKIL